MGHKKRDNKKMAKEFLIPALIAVAIVFTFTQFFGIGFIDGISMKPTYHNGQVFLYSKKSDIENGDVVVFNSRKLKTDLVKRIIASQNDKLEIKNGNVFINGTEVVENYISKKDKATNVSVIIPRGYCFVMGDNRNHSIDSRKFGLIKTDDIYGKVL